MSDKPSDLVQGTLEMLILKTLALEPMHGYGVALRIEQISSGVFRVNPGSLFPASTGSNARPHQGRVARDGEQPPRQVLHPHRQRPQSAEGRNPRMGPPDRGQSPAFSKREEDTVTSARFLDGAEGARRQGSDETARWTKS